MAYDLQGSLRTQGGRRWGREEGVVQLRYKRLHGESGNMHVHFGTIFEPKGLVSLPTVFLV